MLKIRSINTNVLFVTFIAITLVGSAVIYMAIKEYESLYKQQVEEDIQAMSSNLSEDLVAPMARDYDYVQVSNLLLRLNKYDNVIYAKVYSKAWQEHQSFLGNNVALKESFKAELPISRLQSLNLGSHIFSKTMVTINRIGDEKFPLGFLVIVTDYSTPIEESKTSLIYKVLPPASGLIFFSLFFILISQHRLLFPLSQITRFTHQVKKTMDYSLRLKSLGQYEIKELSESINDMMKTIDSEVQKNKQNTEQLIAQQAAMEKLAKFDNLTGLPNRNFFMEIVQVSLAKAQQDQDQVTVMFIDLDGFKGVNDNYGHRVGDLLLIEVSNRMKKCFCETDTVCRLGGDEFLVLMPYAIEQAELISIASKVIESIQSPFILEQWKVNIGASIGITTATDANYDVSNLIGNADIAMYQSKLDGKGKFTIFVPSMMESTKRRFEIVNSIESSLVKDEFYLVYQAKVDVTEKVVGYETLLRWHHPDLKDIYPAEFIPIAEQSGKILAVTKWVLKRLCMELPELLRTSGSEIVVSMNLSANDLKHEDLLDYIFDLFNQYKINPKNIEFEVTESAYLEDFATTNKFISRLKETGCSLALDDFGTGYSSLSYLTQIPIDTLKLDKQFINNIGNCQRTSLVINSIITMAKDLGVKICAEGVENRAQFHYLINAKCDSVQGFLFSRPISLKDMKAVNRLTVNQ